MKSVSISSATFCTYCTRAHEHAQAVFQGSTSSSNDLDRVHTQGLCAQRSNTSLRTQQHSHAHQRGMRQQGDLLQVTATAQRRTHLGLAAARSATFSTAARQPMPKFSAASSSCACRNGRNNRNMQQFSGSKQEGSTSQAHAQVQRSRLQLCSQERQTKQKRNALSAADAKQAPDQLIPSLAANCTVRTQQSSNMLANLQSRQLQVPWSSAVAATCCASQHSSCSAPVPAGLQG
jgi:hypothetical protein